MPKTEEKRKPIPDWEGWYEVSSKGLPRDRMHLSRLGGSVRGILQHNKQGS